MYSPGRWWNRRLWRCLRKGLTRHGGLWSGCVAGCTGGSSSLSQPKPCRDPVPRPPPPLRAGRARAADGSRAAHGARDAAASDWLRRAWPHISPEPALLAAEPTGGEPTPAGTNRRRGFSRPLCLLTNERWDQGEVCPIRGALSFRWAGGAGVHPWLPSAPWRC